MLLAKVVSDAFPAIYGFSVLAPEFLADDPGGDELDALLCAIQAAWSWTERSHSFRAPKDTNPAEGWIADPSLRNANEY